MSMVHLLMLAVHLLATIAKLLRPGGVRAVVAESLLLKHQLVISSRTRQRAPNLNSFDRFILGLGSLFVPASRFSKLAVVLKPRTLLRFHEALKKRKYRRLFSSGGHRRPGPKGPSKERINPIVGFKTANPRSGCPRIAQEIARAFGIDIDKDIVRRVLAKHYRPGTGTDGPSWLSFIGHMKESLWSVDLFRCESILLRSHWVMVVMDVFTRRIIGFGVERADLCGASICRMFNQIIAGKLLPRHLSSDHDPLFRFDRWLANLRILEIKEIKSIPFVPVCHPFVERAPVAQRPHSGRNVWQTAAGSGRPYPLRMAAPLPRSVPDADRGVIYEFAIDTPPQNAHSRTFDPCISQPPTPLRRG